MALTRERILSTALDLLRRYGLGDLSMRRVAQELEVAPGALYYHVRNKQELLVLLAERILASTRPPAGFDLGEAPSRQRLRARVVAEAEAVRECLLRTQDAAEVVTLAMAIRPESLPVLGRIRELLRRGGLQERPAHWGACTVLHAVLGSVSAQQNRQSILGQDPGPEDQEAFAFGVGAVAEGLLGAA